MSAFIRSQWNFLEDCDRFCCALAVALKSDFTAGHGLESAFVVVLQGTLGAGKTKVVQFLSHHLGLPSGVASSPTFTIVHRYATTPPICHIDCYRIADDDELFEIGFEEMLEESAIMLIEWGDKFANLMPNDSLNLHIEIEAEEIRTATLTSTSDRADRVLRSFKSMLESAES